MTGLTFSGKFAKTDDENLKRLFGSLVPIEAINAIFMAEDHKTFGDVRAEVEAMAKAWDPAAVHLGRMKAFRDEISAAIDDAEKRLMASCPWGLTYFVQQFIDAGGVLEDAAQDVSNCLQEDRF